MGPEKFDVKIFKSCPVPLIVFQSTQTTKVIWMSVVGILLCWPMYIYIYYIREVADGKEERIIEKELLKQ